jgi:hypothetical protein
VSKADGFRGEVWYREDGLDRLDRLHLTN